VASVADENRQVFERKNYDTRIHNKKNPKSGLWYVCGFVGISKNSKSLYMPVSQGYKKLDAAKNYMQHLPAAEYAARTCEL